MNFDSFESAIEQDAGSLEAVQAIADGIPAEPGRFVGVETMGIGLAMLVLFRFAQNLSDWNRGRFESDIAERRVVLIERLMQEDGVPFAQASAAVQSLHNQILKGRVSDNLIEKLINMVNK